MSTREVCAPDVMIQRDVANPSRVNEEISLCRIIEWLTLFPMDHFGMQYGSKAKRS